MAKLKIIKVCSGDDRSQAYVMVQLESGESLAQGDITEDGEIELHYVRRGKIAWSNYGGKTMPIEKTWVGKELSDCEFRGLKDENWFKEIILEALSDTPAIFPVNTYPYNAWKKDMDQQKKEYEIPDFNPEDYQKE
jgi:hypothetical protein